MGIDARLRAGQRERAAAPLPRPIRRPAHVPKLIARHSIPALVSLIGRLIATGMAPKPPASRADRGADPEANRRPPP